MERTETKIEFSSGATVQMIVIMSRVYSKCSLELNNEIASLINKVKSNNKSFGIFGSVGELYYNNNRGTFKNLSENIDHRKNVIQICNNLCTAYNNAVKSEEMFPPSSISEDTERIENLLEELCSLLKIKKIQIWM